MPGTPEEIARRIRERMNAVGIRSGSALAVATGEGRSTLTNYLNGILPAPVLTAVAIARELQTTVEWLVTGARTITGEACVSLEQVLSLRPDQFMSCTEIVAAIERGDLREGEKFFFACGDDDMAPEIFTGTPVLAAVSTVGISTWKLVVVKDESRVTIREAAVDKKRGLVALLPFDRKKRRGS